MGDNLNRVYIFNPCYIMRSDMTRVVLATKDNKDFESSKSGNTITLIHPMFAILLSLFRGDKKLSESIEEVSNYFDITILEAENIVGKFINNQSELTVEYDEYFFYFPKNILIEKLDHHQEREYMPNDFLITTTIDLKSKRLNTPLEASILINNRCITDCIYCYADKRKIYDCTIPIERLKEIINEAKSIGITSFDVNGGELFLYEHWYDLLKTLFQNGYNIYLSTKYTLTNEEIQKLVTLGVKEIQISLDSIFPDDLQKSLNVSSIYHQRILKTIESLNEYKIDIKLKAVITRPIFNIERVENYIEFFKEYRHIKSIEITVPSHSLYKTAEEFEGYRLTKQQIEQLASFVENKRVESTNNIEVTFDCPEQDDNVQDKRDSFRNRSLCSGNLSSFIILPNGDVSICEETYFNPNMILGSVLKDSIMEFWNSSRAKELFYITKDKFPNHSACSSCDEFEECRHECGVCWTDVMSAYGEENWLYPSPDCPHAPSTYNNIKVW
ncbi:MAG: radical SAM protein [Bacteroidales bacterium]